MKVTGHVVGLSDVGQDEPPYVLVALAPPHQLADRDPKTLFEAVTTTGTDSVAANVRMVDCRAKECDGFRITAIGRFSPDRYQNGDVK